VIEGNTLWELVDRRAQAPPNDVMLVDESHSSCGRPARSWMRVIRATGLQLFRGYLGSALDAQAFDADGFFRTGELGYVDADGDVVITGRVKDIIIRKGENISAKEVEDVLYGHPKVADFAVVGLPDPARGERCCAVVQSKETNSLLGFEEMTAFCREQGLMTQKIPEQLEVVEKIPRNPVGKVLKHELRKQYSAD
jgi:acyl-CoA synthetase (AMP-forming)/AMP-acid ligase II